MSLNPRILWLAGLLWSGSALAAGDYDLIPEQVAPGVYVFWGFQEPQTPDNGARIANDGFIVGEDAVLVIDSGPNRLYGDQMFDAVASVTDRPVRHLVITHHHFDHAFGMSAFSQRGIEVVMHTDAAPYLASEGAQILGLMTELIGPDWTAGTTIGKPSRTITNSQNIDLGGRIVTITAFGGGHTAGDMVIMDQASKTLFAGDLVFNERPSTVPHADIPTWLDQLDILASWGWELLIPGHGPLVTDPEPLRAAQAYLGFLQTHTACSYRQGDSPVEALMIDIPPPHDHLAMIDVEFQRAVFQLFRKYEASGAPPCDQ